MTSIKILYVSAAARCHPQTVFQKKRMQVQRANLGIVVDESLMLAPTADTCTGLILVMNCILLSAFVGWCIECKTMHGATKNF